MTVCVIDAPAAIELVRRGYGGGSERELFAPTLLRSQVLAILHAEKLSSLGATCYATRLRLSSEPNRWATCSVSPEAGAILWEG